MYEDHKICTELIHGEKCFRVHRYCKGEIAELFHEHVPSRRISLESETEVLRALVGQCEGWNGMFILHSRLNNRTGGPSRHPVFLSKVSYPEAGVIRRYSSAGNATAWSDTVISPGGFRDGVECGTNAE